MLLEALAETTVQTVFIVGWVGAAEHLIGQFVSVDYKEVSRLGIWIVTVFLSGAATEGPRRWLSSTQLLNIEKPLSEDW